MKKRLLSLLVCLCMLASALGVTALAAESESQPDLVVTEGPALYLDGEKLVPTAEGATHTFENGGVATLTNLGTNEAGGTDYALTLENVRATKSVRMAWGENFFAAVFFFIGGTDEISFFEAKDTLAVTLKGTNFIAIQGQPDEIIATALVSTCPLSLSGEGSLFLMAAPAEGAETACIGINVTGDLTVGASLNVSGAGAAMALNGELALTDGATLRWPTELTQADRTDAPIGLGGRTLMNGEAVADNVVVAAPSDPVTRGVAVFNLWKLAGSPKPEGEYPFSDEPMAMAGFLRDAIHWAGATGLANGYGDGKFGDNDPITNEQFAVLFYRMIGSPAVEGDFAADYPYADSVSPWAHDAMLRASQAWNVDPQGILTHAEMDRLVAVLSRAENKSAVPTAYALYCGLNDADTGTQIVPTEKAQEIARKIITDKGFGYSEYVVYGAYTEDNKSIENVTLIYDMFFLEKADIDKVADEIRRALNLTPIFMVEISRNYGFRQ